jgi:hypothetical protein
MHDARDRNQGIWIEPSDRLYVAVYSSVASLVVRVSGYFRQANGEISEYAVTVNPTADRVISEGNTFFGAGFLLSAVAHLASGNANRGQCYVRAQIQRSAGTPAVKLHTVLAGYVTDDYSPSYPVGRNEGPLEGPGALRSITGTNPAAGVEITETVPTGARWRMIAVYVVLVTSADVANRRFHLTFDDGTNIYARTVGGTDMAASITSRISSLVTGQLVAANNTAQVALLPDGLYLAAGHRIISITTSLQALDDYGAPQLYVEEWLEA